VLTLGEELLLLALDADKGLIRGSVVLPYGLSATSLADLAALGRLTLTRPDGSLGITAVADVGEGTTTPPIGDPILGGVFAALMDSPELGRHPGQFIRLASDQMLHTYLEGAKGRGILTWDAPKHPKARYGRFRLLDVEAAAAARARLDRVAAGTGPGERDLDLAAVVHGIGLGQIVFKGLRGRSRRANLARAVETRLYAVLVSQSLPKRPEIDSSRDLAMAKDMIQAVSFDYQHSHGFGHGSDGHHGH
jgi:hypothetical protein